MAKRMSATDLREIIRGVVREEIRDAVVRTIGEVLSERYMKGIVREALDRRVQEIVNRAAVLEQRIPVQGDDPEPEETPEVLENEDEGIYAQSPLKREGREEMLSLFFEGTKPIPAGPGPVTGTPELASLMNESPEPMRVAPAPAVATPVPDMSRWKKVLDGANQRAVDLRPMETAKSIEQLQKELEAKRKALEVPV